MVPTWGRGFRSFFVGKGVYLAIMAEVGLKEVFIFLRLGGGCVSLIGLVYEYIDGLGADRLRRTAGVGITSTETIEGYVDFFLAYLVAL